MSSVKGDVGRMPKGGDGVGGGQMLQKMVVECMLVIMAESRTSQTGGLKKGREGRGKRVITTGSSESGFRRPEMGKKGSTGGVSGGRWKVRGEVVRGRREGA